MARGDGLALLETRLTERPLTAASAGFDPTVIIAIVMQLLQGCIKPTPARLRRRINGPNVAAGLRRTEGLSWPDALDAGDALMSLAASATDAELKSLIDDCTANSTKLLVGVGPTYKYGGTQAGAISYTADDPMTGKQQLKDWVKASDFGEDQMNVLSDTAECRAVLKIPPEVIDDDKNWQGNDFILPASALDIKVAADAPDKCYAVLAKDLFHGGETARFRINETAGKEQFLTVRIAAGDAGADKWTLA